MPKVHPLTRFVAAYVSMDGASDAPTFNMRFCTRNLIWHGMETYETMGFLREGIFVQCALLRACSYMTT